MRAGVYQEALRGLLAAQGRGAAHCPPPARGARGGAAPPGQGRGHGAEAGPRGQEVDREVEAAVEGDQQVGDLDDVGDELTQQTTGDQSLDIDCTPPWGPRRGSHRGRGPAWACGTRGRAARWPWTPGPAAPPAAAASRGSSWAAHNVWGLETEVSLSGSGE